MTRPLVVLAAFVTALAAVPSASAGEAPTVAYARCADSPPQRDVSAARERFGPLTFLGNWAGYAEWRNMEWLRDDRDGTNYAKNPMYARRGTVATLSIGPAYRAAADFVYGRGPNGSHARSDIVRIRACPHRNSFYSGGLVVTRPTCVRIDVRERGSRRVHRKMVSINMGANCPAR